MAWNQQATDHRPSCVSNPENPCIRQGLAATQRPPRRESLDHPLRKEKYFAELGKEPAPQVPGNRMSLEPAAIEVGNSGPNLKAETGLDKAVAEVSKDSSPKRGGM